jgi:hypothetical protein
VLACCEHARPKLRVELPAHDVAPVLEGLEHAAREADRLGLFGRPRMREPLDAVCVGILRGRETALGQRELAQHVLDGLLDDPAVARSLGDDPRMEIGGGEDGVVVQHLLEVRDEPAGVDGVTVEASSHDVVEAAGGHPVEGRGDHLERALVAAAKQELERRRRRELRRRPEPAESRLEGRGNAARRIGEQRRRQEPGRRPRARRRA